jgi:cell division protein FtsW
MTCVAMGLLLRVSYELDRAERRHAVRMGGGEDGALDSVRPAGPATTAASSDVANVVPVTSTPAAPTVRGTSRLQTRVEPTFGRLS